MLSRAEIDKMIAEEQAKRRHLVALWNSAFINEFDPIVAEIAGGVAPLEDEEVIDVWVELPRYGGIVIAVETSAGRILSPFYDQMPNEYDSEAEEEGRPSDYEVAENNPDGYLDMMYGATEHTHWTEYPTTGIRYWGGE